jgi:hypothetical protein
MKVYYNDTDRHCCDWLSNLMDAGLIPGGKIDDTSIADVNTDELAGYSRAHWFAGIAGWELAFQLAKRRGPEEGSRDLTRWRGSCGRRIGIRRRKTQTPACASRSNRGAPASTSLPPRCSSTPRAVVLVHHRHRRMITSPPP